MARREIMWSKQYARSQPRRNLFVPSDHDILPKDHVALLAKFISIAPHIIPTKPGFDSATLRHPNLSFGNILLAPGSSKIAGIIDWQATFIAPFFMQAGYPDFCQHDSSKLQSLSKPSLPEDFDKLSDEEQSQVFTKYRMEEFNLYYTAATGLYNNKHREALQTPHLAMRQYLIQQTSYPWDADLINLRAAMIGITTSDVWNGFTTASCPVTFTQSEREQAEEDRVAWIESAELLATIRDDLGIDLEGSTTHENFERAVQRNAEYRLQMVRHAEEHEREHCWRNWPFKDDDDDAPCPKIVN